MTVHSYESHDLEIHEISTLNYLTKRKKRKLKKRIADDDEINDNDSINNDVIIDKVKTSLIQKEQIITFKETHLEPKQIFTNMHIERLLKFMKGKYDHTNGLNDPSILNCFISHKK